jgi:hypothetical protein
LDSRIKNRQNEGAHKERGQSLKQPFIVFMSACLLAACAGGEIEPLPSPNDTGGDTLNGLGGDDNKEQGSVGGGDSGDSDGGSAGTPGLSVTGSDDGGGTGDDSADEGGSVSGNRPDVIEPADTTEAVDATVDETDADTGGDTDADATTTVDATTVDATTVDATTVDATTVDATTVDAAADTAEDTKEPLALEKGECQTSKDCDSFAMCVTTDAPPMCGICFSPPNTCNDDTECKADDPTFVCKTVACACSGEKTCQPGCMVDATLCKDWQVCDPGGQCLPAPCALDNDCLPSFECGSGQCERKKCADNSDCPAWCVKGKCYAEPGNCMFPPP